MKKKTVGSLCAIGCETLFGLSYLFTRQATERVSAAALLGWRFVVAFCVMSLLAALGVIRIRLKGKSLRPLLKVALFTPVIYFMAETIGIKNTSASESGVFLAVIPAVSVAAAALMLKKKPTRRQVTGICVTFLGVAITVWAVGVSAGLSPVGYAALTAAVLAYSLYFIYADRAAGYSDAEMTYVMLAAGAAVYGLWALLEALAQGSAGALLTLPFRDPGLLTAVLYQGIGCSILAFFLSNAAIARIGANGMSCFLGVSTAVSVIAGALVLKEPFTAQQVLGVAVILAGVYTAGR